MLCSQLQTPSIPQVVTLRSYCTTLSKRCASQRLALCFSNYCNKCQMWHVYIQCENMMYNIGYIFYKYNPSIRTYRV